MLEVSSNVQTRGSRADRQTAESPRGARGARGRGRGPSQSLPATPAGRHGWAGGVPTRDPTNIRPGSRPDAAARGQRVAGRAKAGCRRLAVLLPGVWGERRGARQVLVLADPRLLGLRAQRRTIRRLARTTQGGVPDEPRRMGAGERGRTHDPSARGAQPAHQSLTSRSSTRPSLLTRHPCSYPAPSAPTPPTPSPPPATRARP